MTLDGNIGQSEPIYRHDVARISRATKHSVESLRRGRHVLDWANMPDPFRHYEGVPVLDLPADPPAPEMPALDVLQGTSSQNGVTGPVR